jgi:hypothetical protein
MVNGGGFDLGAAEINANAEPNCHPLCTFVGLGGSAVTDC